MTSDTATLPAPADAPELEIPVLSLARMRRADGSLDPQFLADLRHAAHHVGFFQIVDYGAAEGQVDELFRVSTEFFARPEEEKLSLHNQNSPHYRGYSSIGAERTQGRPDSREQIDFSPEREPVPALSLIHI